jgi:H+/Cl- antiporter ClcA
MGRRLTDYASAVVLVGLLAGMAGAATTLLLHWVEHLTYHYSVGSLLSGISNAGTFRRVVGPMLGGALAGFGWWMLRRRTQVPRLESAIASHAPLPRLTLSIDAGLQVLLVGSGASLGREGAPRQLSATLADLATSRWTLTARDTEILLACAAGAGLGAVYSVPVGGALFSARILLGSWHPRVLGTALLTSALATAVAAPVTHLETPLHWPDVNRSPILVLVAVLVAPLALGVGLAFNRLMARARPRQQIASWAVIPTIAAAGLLVGMCSTWLPQLPGNGKSILTVSVDHDMTIAAAISLLALKPLVTAVFLRAGAVGGLLTPSLATGAALGSAVALSLNSIAGLDLNVSVVSLSCAASVLAITQRAPLWAAIFVWELARPPWWLLLVFVAAATATHALRRAVPHRHQPTTAI